MEPEKFEISQVSLGYLVSKASLYFKINILKAFKEQNFSITLEQFGILYTLTLMNGLYQRQLGKMLMKDRPNITRIINILEKNEFVRRESDPNNKRIFKVCITEKGRDQVEKIRPYMKEIHSRAVVGIPEEQQEFLKEIIGKICENLGDDFALQM